MPNRITGDALDVYFQSKYHPRTVTDAAFAEVVRLNASESCPDTSETRIHVYALEDVTVGIGLDTGFFQVECEDIEKCIPIYDDLFVTRGLDGEELKNYVLVGQYLDLLESPRSLLETTLNTRDLGGYASEATGRPLRRWRILRSDVQNYPSEKDLALLQSRNVRTVIDMRGEKEVQRRPSGFCGRAGFTYINIPIDEGSGIPESVDAVSGSYLCIAESKNIARVFRAIAASSGGVMVNCTAGKDRTGVVSAVLLGLCGVADDTIVYDYLLTKTYNRERFALIHKNFPEIDMNIVIPHERYMREFIELLRGRYGSWKGYLSAIGVTDEEMDGIRNKLEDC